MIKRLPLAYNIGKLKTRVMPCFLNMIQRTFRKLKAKWQPEESEATAL